MAMACKALAVVGGALLLAEDPIFCGSALMLFATTVLCLTILITVVTNEPLAAIDEKVDVASLDVDVKEVAARASVVSLYLSFAVPKLATVLRVCKVAQLIDLFTEASVAAVWCCAD